VVNGIRNELAALRNTDGILNLTSNSLIFLKQQPSFGPKRLFFPISSPNWLRTNAASIMHTNDREIPDM
jgi:hypothetical protein